MKLNIYTIIIISMVCGKIARIIYRAITDNKEDEEEIDDEQKTTDTAK